MTFSTILSHFLNFFWKPGLSADYFLENFKCVSMRFKTLKNDFRHYHTPFSEIFFGTPDRPRTVRGSKNVFRKWLWIVLKVIFESLRVW